MKTRNEIFLRLCDLDCRAQDLLAAAGFSSEGGCSPFACADPDDPQERFLQEALNDLLAPFESLHEALVYLKRPTHGTYPLKRLANGRYGYVDQHGICQTFTCGSPVEALITDENGQTRWVRSRFEHNGQDYFLWQYDTIALDGLMVRERW